MQIAIATVFVVWLLASVLVYLPHADRVIRRHDHLLLIPNWQFFAPIPARHDCHFLYQDKYADGTLSQWTEVRIDGRRRWFNLAWNPDKRLRKALFDIEQQMIEHLAADDKGIEVSVPYLTLLNYVSRLQRTTPPRFTRFLMMRARTHVPTEDRQQIVYISGFHRL
ncbi:MAG: hypothetical protein WCB92_34365 [Mycobacterium sp.]